MNVMRYSIGTSWFTSNGRSLRKIFPTTRTKLNTAMAKSTLTTNSRLTNRSISFMVRVSWASFHPARGADCQWFIEFSTQSRNLVARMPRLLGKRKTNSSAIGRPEFLKIAKRTHAYVKIPKIKVLTHAFSSKYNCSKNIWEKNQCESK